MLFNIVADMLTIFIARANKDGQSRMTNPHLAEGALSICNAYNAILFMELDLQKVINMKLIFCVFAHLSRLNIIFHKSEIFCFGEVNGE
jgi:hypothetical protein